MPSAPNAQVEIKDGAFHNSDAQKINTGTGRMETDELEIANTNASINRDVKAKKITIKNSNVFM